jgi:PAS domain-containing protein
MLTKIGERAANSSLRPEFVCGEANFRTIAEGIACAIFISQGEQLNYVNHVAETMTGYAREELLSMNFWDLVRPRQPGAAPRRRCTPRFAVQSIRPRDTVAMSLPSSCLKLQRRPQGLSLYVFVAC